MAFPEFPTSLDARLTHLAETRAALLREIDAVALAAGLSPAGDPVAAGSSLASAPGPLPAGTDDGLKARATTDVWSVAEIVYHLHLSEKSIARLLRKRLAAADRHQPAGDEQLRTEWERVEGLIGTRKSKVKAPAFVEPIEVPPLATGIDLLGQSRQALLDVVHSVPYADLLSISAPHRFDAVGILTGASWLSAAAFHEHRHTEQHREIKCDGE